MSVACSRHEVLLSGSKERLSADIRNTSGRLHHRSMKVKARHKVGEESRCNKAPAQRARGHGSSAEGRHQNEACPPAITAAAIADGSRATRRRIQKWSSEPLLRYLYAPMITSADIAGKGFGDRYFSDIHASAAFWISCSMISSGHVRSAILSQGLVTLRRLDRVAFPSFELNDTLESGGDS